MISQEQNLNEFNNAIGYIQRLDKIFYLILQSKLDNNIEQYLKSLQGLFHELSTELKTELRTIIRNKLREVNEEIQGLKKFRINNQIKYDLYYTLEEIELDLRNVYKNSGLMMKMRKGAGSSLE